MQTSMLRGALTGLAAGLIASWVMNKVPPALERLGLERPDRLDRGQSGQPRQEEQAGDYAATVKIAEALWRGVTGNAIPREHRPAAGNVVHYAFGAATAALYAVLAPRAPIVTTARGAAFGTAVWLGEEAALPALGLTAPPQRYPRRAHAAALLGHVVYGVVTDTVRRALRAA